MAVITITLPFGPEQEVFIIWDNKIQKAICSQINVNVTKPGITVLQDKKVKMQLLSDNQRIVYKPLEEVFLSADLASDWMDANVQPPTIP